MFTAPNNSAIMSAAATEETGQAGGLLNVMRSLGMSLGISLASVILARQLPVLTGRAQATLGSSVQDLLRAAAATFAVLAALAGVAALLSLIRADHQNHSLRNAECGMRNEG